MNWGKGYGGGMYIFSGTVSLISTKFASNSADHRGGGMYIWYRSRDLAHSGREKQKQKWSDFASRDPLISRPVALLAQVLALA